MIGTPLRSEGRYTRRGETCFFVTLRPGGSPGGGVSALAGHAHRPGQDVAVTIDGRRDQTRVSRDPPAAAAVGHGRGAR
jgi:hypothetical protein